MQLRDYQYELIEEFKNRKVKAKSIFSIKEIDKSIAYDFIRKYHYLQDAKFFAKYSYGLFIGDVLVGCSTFSNPQGISAMKGWFGLSNSDQSVLELSRLCMLPILNGTNATSYLLGNSMKMLKNKNVKAVITLADDSRHVGSIYQVCNFKYYGLTDKKTDFFCSDGKVNPRGKTKDLRGVWLPRTQKHRYCYLLDNSLNVLIDEHERPNIDNINQYDCCNGSNEVFDKRFGEKYTCPKCTGEIKLINDSINNNVMELRDYQYELSVEASYRLVNYGMAYLSMEVRTGKTLTAFAAAAEYIKAVDNYKGKVLFVTKKKAINDIIGQFEAYEPDYITDFSVVNYESLHKCEDEADELDVIILDEAHSIGAFPKPSKRFKDIRAILNRKGNGSTVVLFLSGTPSPESYSQLYHQFAVSKYYSPFREWSSFYKWAGTFVNKKQKYVGHGNPVNDYSDAKKDLIDKHLDKYFLTYTQGQAGFNIEVKEEVLKVKMKDVTYRIINTLLKDLVFEGNEKTIVCDTGVKLQQKVHQLCSGTIKFEDGSHAITDVTKAEFIRNKFSGKKIAIFYKFKAEYELLKEVFPNHTSDPQEFADDWDKVFLGQIQSVREGINLSCADYLIMYNIDFSATSYWQGRDRLSTKDRTKENKVYWIFAEDGIEDKIYKTVMNKRNYTLSHFNRDYDRASNSKEDNDSPRGQGVLFD
jgi:hypothetical protein